MNPLRDALLWASEQRTLRTRLPRYRSVRRTVARFMPGETAEEAIAAARRLAVAGIPATFTYLGENVADPGQAESATREYLMLLDRVAAEGLDAEISVKLTQLGFDLDRDRAFDALERLAERSQELDRHLWIDMESSAYVDGTLQLYRRVLERFPKAGVCLQAYLHRTPEDVVDLLPLGASIRLVKGAYREPSELAAQDRHRVADRFAVLAMRCLMGDDRGRLALGTHDTELIARIDRAARREGKSRDAFEVQMLYGIREADQHRLARAGYRLRVLIAYGPHWYPWFMRRMAERPANVLFAIRNLLAPRPSGPTGTPVP